ncbi:hypothetical protein J1N35_024607 [Gossypium stocksii]|uniref:Uncharacterized protein n=1 Tax=Gossypium stocksii TaxID=47602 RepID=A0A9D3V4W3_9ROSI|nr:hypothetical protein J1N35_024607 [Gossypium stocksii]
MQRRRKMLNLKMFPLLQAPHPSPRALSKGLLLCVEAKAIKKVIDRQKALQYDLLALPNDEYIDKFVDQKGGMMM